jgi:ubiquinone/menaquinone biosynthesis C-methylase UbiE
MEKEENTRICPVERAGGLDNFARRLLQNPKKILKPYIKDGMQVLDLGCGPGFFSIEIAKMLIKSGKVIAADMQEGMLEIVKQKIKGTEAEQRVIIHKCKEDQIDYTEKVDFVLAFYVIHEVADQEKLFRELKSILNPNGQLFIIEPKFHVTKRSFDSMVECIQGIGFEVEDKPKVFFSRSIVFKNKE